MDQKTLFLQFWEKEAPATRKVIERIPQERSDYRADPKARTAREIAWLLVQEEIVLADGLERGTIEWVDRPVPATMQEILDVYNRNHDRITSRLRSLDGARWEQRMPFVFQGAEMMQGSGYEFGWGFLFDQVHHRGQLSTYLRPMGSTVPAIYGPSADESM